MRTSVIESPYNIIIKDATIPEIEADEVLVRLEGTGVCASNLPVWEGRAWFKYPIEPGSPGHEGYGIIADKGSNSHDIEIGDKVSLISYHAYAEYDKTHYSNVVKIPPSISNIPFPGEPVACAVNVFKRSDIRKGQTVLIIGAGFLGCLLIQLIRNAGANVIAVSRRDTSLEYARKAGADELIHFGDFRNTVKRINELSESGGIQRIIEATGVQSSIDLATEVISVRGKFIIAGYHQDGMRNVNMQAWNWKGIDIINAHERDPLTYIEGLKEAISLTEKNILQPQKYITHFLEFTRINEAFTLLKNRPESFLKAVITY